MLKASYCFFQPFFSTKKENLWAQFSNVKWLGYHYCLGCCFLVYHLHAEWSALISSHINSQCQWRGHFKSYQGCWGVFEEWQGSKMFYFCYLENSSYSVVTQREECKHVESPFFFALFFERSKWSWQEIYFKYIVFEIILYLRVHIIIWMMMKSSPYVVADIYILR